MDLKQFIAEVERKLKINLSGYREDQVRRRFALFMKRYGISDYSELLDKVLHDPKIQKDFIDRLTINVSEFFRNPDKWEYLKRTIIPELIKETGKLKAWSAGCSVGCEPYTLALIMKVDFPHVPVTIIATDIDDGALARAREGRYFKREMVNVKGEYLKYFTKVSDEEWVISPEIKRMVTFRKHNLITDPPIDKGFDLVMCRNVVIYFEREHKQKVWEKLASALRVGGYLFVGGSEIIFGTAKMGLKLHKPGFYKKVENKV
ncbi:chemotaxis protein CheR [bacterium 3DAC]|jgi:chemotaxis protein methyltransferase CheR|nr:protein-glutamate O-methyltransferase CheR [Dictyoglomota bacterium]UZN22987.1 chemotaxis protein CheR [bacterium 3DAC]